MLGRIISYEEDSRTGIIEVSNGDAYLFDGSSVAEGCYPFKGQAVYFELNKSQTIAMKVAQILPRFRWLGVALLMLVLSACALPKGDTGTNGIDGTNGKQGEVGHDGVNGTNGQDGAQGPQGNPGQDLANVHVVQFCPNQGATTHTPAHFPEYGICISNVLFAVMDDSFHTWLAEIPPGTYQTTSTGLICTFIVLSNCGVQ